MKDGFPIYLEKSAREIVSLTSQQKNQPTWHPANGPTKRLIRCVEALRDIDDILEDALVAKAEAKRRRKFKHLFTPLLSLVECAVELLQIIQSDPQSSTLLSPKDCQLLTKVRLRFLEHVPLTSDSLLKKIRHKVSAHIDKDLWPSELTDLFGQAEPHLVGKWLHVSLGVLMDALKLPVYSWQAEPTPPGTLTIMNSEPFVVTFRLEENRIVEMLSCDMAARSPRQDVFALIQSAVDHSRWMFRDGDFQIKGWTVDSEEQGWASTLRNLE